MERPTRHLLLRDRRHWLGALAGVAVGRDGELALARVPGPADGKAITVPTPLPAPRVASGLATGPCEALFVADTARHRVLFVDGLCGARAWLGTDGVPGDAPGQFDSPRGLAVTREALLVADSGNARIAFLAMPLLEPAQFLAAGPAPASLAVDSRERLLIVDTGARRLRRRDADGWPDGAFDAAVAASNRLPNPLGVTVAEDDHVVVSDVGADALLVFDADGAFVRELDGPAGWMPGAVAARGTRVYCADASTGTLLAFDLAGACHGPLPGYRGPVTALAIGAAGELFVKPGLDATFHVLAADADFVAAGTVEAGPFDAGEQDDWERAWAEVELPVATRCRIEVVLKPQPVPAPLPSEWAALPCLDALLAPAGQPPGKPESRRQIWLRASLSTSDPKASPVLRQLRAATAAEDYREHLPLVYAMKDARPDGAEGFLSRLLKLVRSQWSGVEERLDDMPRVARPDFAEATSLPWLAQWLALELPVIADDEERRAILARAIRLFARRGTPGSIADFVEMHTGIRPAILEGFADRHLWVLGESSRLDFDTGLAPLDPLGMVVADAGAGAADGCCPDGPTGRAIVGESGPLAGTQLGLPLFSEDAWKFCVLVDAYRVRDAATLREIRRIVEREKPAHADYRIELVQPDMRVGMQSRVGMDAIVGGEPPAWRLEGTLGLDTRLARRDGASRIGEATLGDPLQLT